MAKKIVYIFLFLVLILGLFSFFYFTDPFKIKESELSKKRKAMVEGLVINYGIMDDKVINAMLKVKRHFFVSKNLRDLSYGEKPLPIGEGQFITDPYLVALTTELLELKGHEKLLEIGTGTGYQAAVMAQIAKQVYTIEIFESLAKVAQNTLDSLGYKNVKVKCGNGWLGWPEYAPFDAIIVTCAPDEVPRALIDQLADGGRMVVPIGEEPYQELKVIRKINGNLKVEKIARIKIGPMLQKTQ